LSYRGIAILTKRKSYFKYFFLGGSDKDFYLATTFLIYET